MAQQVADIGNSAGVDALAKKRKQEIIDHDVAAGAVIGAGTVGTAGAVLGGSIGAGLGGLITAFTGGLGAALVPGLTTVGAAIGGAAGALVGGALGAGVGAIEGEIRGEIEANNVRTDKELQEKISEAARKIAEDGKEANEENLF